MIHFPFWLVTPSGSIADPDRLPLAFSTLKRMSGYLSDKTSGQWAVQLVNRYSVAEVCGELQKSGIRAICYHAGDDGADGTEISLDNLVAIGEAQ